MQTDYEKAVYIMKDNYDFKKMQQIPHPLKKKKSEDGSPVVLPSIRDISDDEFEKGISELSVEERNFATEYRRRGHVRRPARTSTVSSVNAPVSP